MDSQGRPRPRRRFGARAREREGRAVLKRVYILPNLFTTGAMFCGMLALVRIFQGRFETACWLVLAAGVLDVFDGLVARLTHTESQFGLNYDSLSDVVTFGVAPALLVMWFLSGGDPNGIHPWISGPSILFAICGALRLARFGVQAKGQESKSFTGLPIPGGAGVSLTAFLVFKDYGRDVAGQILPMLMVLLAFLMVSKVPYPSLKSVNIKHRKPFNMLVVIVFAIVILNWLKIELTLFVLGLIYLVWGLVRMLPKFAEARKERSVEETGPSAKIADVGEKRERRPMRQEKDEDDEQDRSSEY